jgi:hypothetical protein
MSIRFSLLTDPPSEPMTAPDREPDADPIGDPEPIPGLEPEPNPGPWTWRLYKFRRYREGRRAPA